MTNARTVALSALTVLPCSPLELIDAAAEAGFTHSGLRITQAMEGDVDVLGDPALMARIATHLRDTGITPLDLELTRIGPETEPADAETLFAFGQTIGAGFVTITAEGNTPWSPDEESESLRRLDRLAALAERYSMRLSLEFMPYRAITDIAHATRILRTVGSSAIGLCVDALHLQRSGGSPTDVAQLDPALLAVVQVCDAPITRREGLSLAREARSDRLFPGDGELPLVALIAAVPPEVPLSIEVPLRDRAGCTTRELARRAHASMSALVAATDSPPAATNLSQKRQFNDYNSE